MKRRLLFVDTFSGYGHVDLVRTFVAALNARDFQVDLVFREGYHTSVDIPAERVVLTLPARPQKHLGKLRARVLDWKALVQIKTTLALDDYDIVFLAAFDEIALTLAYYRHSHLYALVHKNASGLSNPIKRAFMRVLSHRAKFVVFNRQIETYMRSHGFRDIQIAAQGWSKSLSDVPEGSDAIGDKFPEIERHRIVAFVPTLSKDEDHHLREMLLTPEVSEFAAEHDILFVVKDPTFPGDERYFLNLDVFISRESYEYIMSRVSLVILYYPPTFEYRISAALFECFGRGIPCVLSDIKAFRFYSEHFRYDPFFSDLSGFMSRLNELISGDILSDSDGPYLRLEALQPDFSFL